MSWWGGLREQLRRRRGRDAEGDETGVDGRAARDGDDRRGVEAGGGGDVGGIELRGRDWRRLAGDGGERVAMTLPGLEVIIGRNGPFTRRVQLEVQVRGAAGGIAGVADEAHDVPRADAAAVDRDRRTGR